MYTRTKSLLQLHTITEERIENEGIREQLRITTLTSGLSRDFLKEAFLASHSTKKRKELLLCTLEHDEAETIMADIIAELSGLLSKNRRRSIIRWSEIEGIFFRLSTNNQALYRLGDAGIKRIRRK